MKFIIKDWAGNICFKGKTFDTFEDAWDYIYNTYAFLPQAEFDAQMGEYFVEPFGLDIAV